VSALPPNEQTALILRYWLDLPVDQVAEIMQRPPNTVKTLTRRGGTGERR
jgi:DNA-directed RNA polymerase specialized sigma24 family protein